MHEIILFITSGGIPSLVLLRKYLNEKNKKEAHKVPNALDVPDSEGVEKLTNLTAQGIFVEVCDGELEDNR
jgi:hypothetical protein